MFITNKREFFKALNITIKMVAILLTIVYGSLLVDHFSYLFGNPFNGVFWEYTIDLVMKACLINLGLWLTTTNVDRKYGYVIVGLVLISFCAGALVFFGMGQPVLAILVMLVHIIAIGSFFRQRSVV